MLQQTSDQAPQACPPHLAPLGQGKRALSWVGWGRDKIASVMSGKPETGQETHASPADLSSPRHLVSGECGPRGSNRHTNGRKQPNHSHTMVGCLQITVTRAHWAFKVQDAGRWQLSPPRTPTYSLPFPQHLLPAHVCDDSHGPKLPCTPGTASALWPGGLGWHPGCPTLPWEGTSASSTLMSVFIYQTGPSQHPLTGLLWKVKALRVRAQHCGPNVDGIKVRLGSCC